MEKLLPSTWYVGYDHRVSEPGQKRTISGDAKRGLYYRYMRSAHRRSRILVSGSATTRVREHTTCTRNTGKCQERRRWMHYTRIWQPGIGRGLGRSTYVAPFAGLFHCSILIRMNRFSKLSSSRRPTTSSAHTSSSSSPRSSSFLSLTVSPKLPRKLFLQLTVLRPLLDRKAVWKWVSGKLGNLQTCWRLLACIFKQA